MGPSIKDPEDRFFTVLHLPLLVALSTLTVLGFTFKGAGLLIALVLSVWALRGTRETVEALSLLAFSIMLSSFSDLLTGRWIVLAAVSARVVWDTFVNDAPFPRFSLPLFIFSSIIFLTSTLFGTAPLISALKLTAFTLGVGAILICLYRTYYLRDFWMSWFYTLAVFISCASIPLYFTSYGFTRSKGLFQGVLGHPQTFGPVSAIFGVYFLSLVIFYQRRSWQVLVPLLASLFGVYASGSRTAMLAMVLGLTLATINGYLNSRFHARVIAAISSPLVIVSSIIAFVLAIFFWGAIRQAAVDFLVKDEDAVSVAEALQSSRGALIERALNNFEQDPLTGIGFGVPSSQELTNVKRGFLDLPTSASTEKGFLPAAVLEETGLVGTILLIMLIVALVAPVARNGSPPVTAILYTCLLINLGEMVFFSIGGMGLHMWMMMGFAYMLAQAESIRRAHLHHQTYAMAS